MNGYEGTNCQTNIDDCTVNSVVCENGGTCQVNFECELEHAVVPMQCHQLVTCISFTDIFPHAVLKDGVNSYSCLCVAGFTGSRCETNIDECISDPCENGGNCTVSYM